MALAPDLGLQSLSIGWPQAKKGQQGQRNETIYPFTPHLPTVGGLPDSRIPSSPLCLPLIYHWGLHAPLPCRLSGPKPSPPPRPTNTSLPRPVSCCQPHPPQLPALVLAPPLDFSFQPPPSPSRQPWGIEPSVTPFPCLDLTLIPDLDSWGVNEVGEAQPRFPKKGVFVLSCSPACHPNNPGWATGMPLAALTKHQAHHQQPY